MEINTKTVCTKSEGNCLNFDIVDGFFKGVKYHIVIDPEDISTVDYTVDNPEFVQDMIMKVLEGVIQADITTRLTETLDKAEKGD